MDLLNIQRASAQILSKDISNYKRYLYERIDFASKLIGIKGARGAGKSTLMLQYAKSLELPASKLLFVSADHPAMSGVSLYDLADAFYARGGKVLIIDEIHKSPDFSKELKAIYDFFDLQVVFSGSSAIEIAHSTADLSRRAAIYTLNVLSLREFAELETGEKLPAFTLDQIVSNHQDIASEIMKKIRPLEQFTNYLEYGAYPFFLESKRQYPLSLLEVVNLTIDLDLAQIYSIDPSKLDKLKKIIYMLCSSKPYELNISKLASATELSWATIQKYLAQMDAGSLVRIVRGGSGMRAVNKPDKLLLDNPNLFAVLCANADKGAIRESFFASQLGSNHQVHYHNQGDFLIDDRLVFEVGGKGKSFDQIRGVTNSFLAVDDIEIGADNRIPLWLFGFLY